MSKIKNTKPVKGSNVTLISIGANSMQNKMISNFAKENDLGFMTYTESEWATFEEIDQYIQEEELSKQIVSLPVGANKDVSLSAIGGTTKKSSQIKNFNVNKTAKRLKIERAALYRKLEKQALKLKKEREIKKAS